MSRACACMTTHTSGGSRVGTVCAARVYRGVLCWECLFASLLNMAGGVKLKLCPVTQSSYARRVGSRVA